MNCEELIKNVRLYEALYAMDHAKYSDNFYKENAWKEIGKKMKQPAALCKKTWFSLRDSFRRAIKKRRETKSGQAAPKMRKWRFDDEMSFLVPHLKERETCTNLAPHADDGNEDVQHGESEIHTENKDINRDNDDADIKNVTNDDKNNTNESGTEDTIITKNTETRNKIRRKQRRTESKREAASAVVMKYLLENKQNAVPTTERSIQQLDATDMFFSSIAATVKTFSPYYRNIAKSQIFNIISKLELKQIVQNQQKEFPLPDTAQPRSCSVSIPPTSVQMQNLYDLALQNIKHSSPSSCSSVTPCPSPLADNA